MISLIVHTILNRIKTDLQSVRAVTVSINYGAAMNQNERIETSEKVTLLHPQHLKSHATARLTNK